MGKKMLIDATHAEETRVVVVDGNKVDEFDFEAASRRQLAGNIYLAKVMRVEPSLQAAFVDYGGNRHGFLAFAEIHPDYYQIPVADRQALLAEERARAETEEETEAPGRGGKAGARGAKPRAAAAQEAGSGADEVASGEIPGMAVVDLQDGDQADDASVADGDSRIQDSGVQGSGDQDDQAEAEGTDAASARPYAAVDHAAEIDDRIESIADEDVSDEIRVPRKSAQRRYKIQEVIKVRQILLVQVVKEERGNKGAALTTYLSLAGRYCVLMPNTARGGGISRKITNAADRKKLKEIAGAITVPEGAGLIIRTAGAKRTKAEIKRDYEYLFRLWEQIRELTLKSIAPAPIYEEGNLIKRSIRDLYNREIDEVWVEGAEGYRVAKDFMKMIMPSHARNVKQYTDPMPLFARHQVESYLAAMFNPTVQLKSGGYIVIGITEALVSIDVNSGRATKEGSIEDTALKTNLEAAEEIARQLRLRDLAGLIVIDFIDMEERKNNNAVEKRFKEKLKTDRARIQVGRISGFGLLEMSRQRLRPGMLEATTQPCPSCHGTGLIRSDDSQALAILRQLEEEGTRKRSREVLLKAAAGIVNFLINHKREHIAQIEARYGMAVRLEADPMLISPDFSIEKFKTATRPVAPAAPVISVDTSTMPEVEDEPAEETDAPAAEEPAETTEAAGESGEGGGGRRKRRRRRRRRGGAGENGSADQSAADEAAETPAQAGDVEPAAQPGQAASDSKEGSAAEDAGSEAPAPKRPSRSRSRRKPAAPTPAAESAPQEAGMAAEPSPAAQQAKADATIADEPTQTAAADEGGEAPKPASRRRRSPRKPASAEAQPDAPQEEPSVAPAEAESKPAPRKRRRKPAAARPEADASAEAPAPETPAPQRAADTVAAAAEAPGDDGAPKRSEEVAPDSVQAEMPAGNGAEEEAAETSSAERPRRRRGWWALGR